MRQCIRREKREDCATLSANICYMYLVELFLTNIPYARFKITPTLAFNSIEKPIPKLQLKVNKKKMFKAGKIKAAEKTDEPYPI